MIHVLHSASRRRAAFPLAVVALAVAAAAAYHATPDLPLAPQSDEPKKADFVISGRQDFFHPIMMLQTVRLINFFAGRQDIAGIVELGRAAAAVFGGLAVLATVILARRIVDKWLALAAGALAAVTPLFAVHAQLFKEDIFVAPWLLLSVAALDWLGERPGPGRAALFGLTAGLAMSSKYIGVIMLPLACLAPLLGNVPRPLLRYYGHVAVAAAVALAVFAGLNFPALIAPGALAAGLNTEIQHALIGHIIVAHGWYTHFLFHLETSLIPGAGLLLSLTAFVGALLVVRDWRSGALAIHLVLVFGIAWYLLHELSPMKPFMGIERHMTVIGGVMAILGIYCIDRTSRAMSPPWGAALAAMMFAAMALPLTYTTFALARSAPVDTRVVEEQIIAALDGRVALDWYATMSSYAAVPPLSSIDASSEYVAIAETVARRFIGAEVFPNQPPDVKALSVHYRDLFEKPAILLRSSAGSFSYRNVPVRIVALHKPADQLLALVARAGPLLGTRITVFPGVSSARNRSGER